MSAKVLTQPATQGGLFLASKTGLILDSAPARVSPTGQGDPQQTLYIGYIVGYIDIGWIYPTFRTLTVHYLRLATGRMSEGELLARTVDGGLYREQLKYLRLNRC